MAKKTWLVFGIALLLSAAFVLAHGHDFSETKELIGSGIGCSQLTEEQLEAIGDYYMEQMHPGEAHEMMDQMMGGEGSESLRQVHINMARRLYCNENIYIGYGMMGSGGMMGGGMMSMFGGRQFAPANMMPGIMGGGSSFGYWNIASVLYVLLLIGLIILIYFWIVRLRRDSCGRKK